MKKTILISLSIIVLVILSACEKMDDNYKHYLDLNIVYSPKVTNLDAIVGLKQATLFWDNPSGDIAKSILIDFQDDSLHFNTMIDSVFLDSLEIKGYLVKVYTIDQYDNKSVPAEIQIFPNGEK